MLNKELAPGLWLFTSKGWVGFVPWAWVSVTEVLPRGTEPWGSEQTLQSSLRGFPALGGEKLCLLREEVGPGVMREMNLGSEASGGDRLGNVKGTGLPEPGQD